MQAHDFVAIVGPSGCGKTTLLHLIAGFIPSQAGEIRIDGEERRNPSSDCVLISQEYSLFDWKTVLENVTLGLKVRGLRPTQRIEKAKHYLELVDLVDVTPKYPRELSAGMKQRLALARALVVEPKLLLMDEPFVSLDSQSRLKLREELLRICEIANQTVLITTHDVGEAIYLADRVIVLSKKPAEISKTVHIPFPKRRLPELRYDSKFLALEQEILAALM
jgi:NitT/TauT family transport system ATP-binding protein